jgi:CYTH domain-containing protein
MGSQQQVRTSKMKFERVFRISPSIVRVLLKDRPTTTNVVEGYLQSTPERTQFIRLEATGCQLILQRSGDQERNEEHTKLPTRQAEALLDVSQGRVGYRRTQFRIDGDHVALLARFEQPVGLDLVTVEFDDRHQAEEFSPLGWFGPEVTQDGQFRKSKLAVAGAPVINEVEVNNAAVIALIDMLESAPRHQSGSSASPSLKSISTAESLDRTQPMSTHSVLRLPPRVRRLPDVEAAALDPRVTDLVDEVAKALERAPIEGASDTTPDEDSPEIRRAASRRPFAKVFGGSKAS